MFTRIKMFQIHLNWLLLPLAYYYLHCMYINLPILVLVALKFHKEAAEFFVVIVIMEVA